MAGRTGQHVQQKQKPSQKLFINKSKDNKQISKIMYQFRMAEYIPQVYRGRFGRKHRFDRVRYFQLFVVITTIPTEE